MSKQLVSFVLDNSASVSKEKLAALMNGFRRLAASGAQYPFLEWELLTFDAFAPDVVKSFADAEIRPVRAGRMPLLRRATQVAADRLLSRVSELESAGEEVFRPWIVILSDGFTFDEPSAVVAQLEEMEQSGRLMYLPFKLSGKLYTERMQSLDRVKHMITIKEGQIDQFFTFFEGMLDRRAEGAEGGLKFRKNDFEGWAVL
ncbi:MAG: hypothetical protein E7624_05445 [Ruminococcaceae bacterium]|nr:hypothetical protein [Oscillospiraceae bacterium]